MEPKSSKSDRPTEMQTLTEEMTSQLPLQNLRCIENKTLTEATNLLTAYLFNGSTRLLLRTRLVTQLTRTREINPLSSKAHLFNNCKFVLIAQWSLLSPPLRSKNQSTSSRRKGITVDSPRMKQ